MKYFLTTHQMVNERLLGGFMEKDHLSHFSVSSFKYLSSTYEQEPVILRSLNEPQSHPETP